VKPYANDLHSLSRHASNDHHNKSGSNNQTLLHGGALLGLGFVIANCAEKYEEDKKDNNIQGRIIGIFQISIYSTQKL